LPTLFELPGRVTSDGRLEIDGLIPLSAGPVRVSIHSSQAAIIAFPGESDWAERRARLLSLAGAISDEDATAALEAIERGCEQINPDDWR
jgi:hypothetical protein